MAIPLKIKGLCLSMGYCEGARATTMLVHWEGKPFTDAKEAIRSFVGELRRICKAPEVKRKPCCVATLAAKPSAKACPDCGSKFKRGADTKPRDVFERLWNADVDGWSQAIGSFADEEEHGTLSKWRFFVGIPADCDVVEVDQFEKLIDADEGDAVSFTVLHVGKRATRASANSEITPDEVGS